MHARLGVAQTTAQPTWPDSSEQRGLSVDQNRFKMTLSALFFDKFRNAVQIQLIKIYTAILRLKSLDRNVVLL
jgi:hypothetical protein